MGKGDIAPALMVACFALLMLAFSQLARIQKEAIGHLRRVSAEETRRIYNRDYQDGDGARFDWREMRDYCRDVGAMSRLSFWLWITAAAIAGGVGSIFLDQAMR